MSAHVLIGCERSGVLRRAFADGALERTEVLRINPAAQRAHSSGPLFENAA